MKSFQQNWTIIILAWVYSETENLYNLKNTLTILKTIFGLKGSELNTHPTNIFEPKSFFRPAFIYSIYFVAISITFLKFLNTSIIISPTLTIANWQISEYSRYIFFRFRFHYSRIFKLYCQNTQIVGNCFEITIFSWAKNALLVIRVSKIVHWGSKEFSVVPKIYIVL